MSEVLSQIIRSHVGLETNIKRYNTQKSHLSLKTLRNALTLELN